MINADSVISFLDDLSYPVQLSPTGVINLAEETTLPSLYVSYATIQSKNPNDPTGKSYFDSHGEDLIQYFDVHICTSKADLHTVWRAVYTKLVGWNTALDKYATGFTYMQGGMQGIDNGRVWWADRWGIAFPTVNVNF